MRFWSGSRVRREHPRAVAETAAQVSTEDFTWTSVGGARIGGGTGWRPTPSPLLSPHVKRLRSPPLRSPPTSLSDPFRLLAYLRAKLAVEPLWSELGETPQASSSRRQAGRWAGRKAAYAVHSKGERCRGAARERSRQCKSDAEIRNVLTGSSQLYGVG